MSRLFTDTDCELWYEDVDKYNINLIKMPYTINDKEDYYDMGRTTKYLDFIKEMRAGAQPSTSALNPDIYMEYFEPVLKSGEDILYIHFSDKMSGTFNYMNLAIAELKEKYPDRKITLFNTKSICFGAGFQVLEAAKMHHNGASDEEIISFLEEFSKHVCINFAVESLTYLKRGGRISSATAVVGGILNIKPILRFNDEGEIVKVGNVNGMKRAVMSMVDQMADNITGNYPVYVADADNEQMREFAKSYIKQKLGEDRMVVTYPIGPVICAHCGPGTVGIIYYGKERK